ncbi:unnamed protein product, partial [Ectocarpus sp. 12 AP-2014]
MLAAPPCPRLRRRRLLRVHVRGKQIGRHARLLNTNAWDDDYSCTANSACIDPSAPCVDDD